MFWLDFLQKIFKALNADISPNEVAAGFVLGAMIGLIPKFNLIALALWILVILFRVNISMALLATIVFAVVGAITDPWVEKLGFWLLSDALALRGLWTTLYNLPIVPFSSFNNTLVMGNLAFGLLIALPLFFGFRRFVVTYRTRYREKILKWKIVQTITASKTWDLYQRWVNR